MSAQLVFWQAVQVAHVPLFAKISIGVPVVFHALIAYRTSVPAGCAGMLAVDDVHVLGVVDRSKNEQR